jgi:hypothetical protein
VWPTKTEGFLEIWTIARGFAGGGESRTTKKWYARQMKNLLMKLVMSQ